MRRAPVAATALFLLACVREPSERAPPGGDAGVDLIGASDAASLDLGGAAEAVTRADAFVPDATFEVATGDGGFAADFAVRARAAIAASAPPWTCGSVLPAVPVGSTDEARATIRQFVAQVVGVPPGDIDMQVVECATPTTRSCGVSFAHHLGKSGGSLSTTLLAPAEELDMNAASVEETIWSPRRGDTTLPGDVALAGIADGVLVGMIVFNDSYDCP